MNRGNGASLLGDSIGAELYRLRMAVKHWRRGAVTLFAMCVALSWLSVERAKPSDLDQIQANALKFCRERGATNTMLTLYYTGTELSRAKGGCVKSYTPPALEPNGLDVQGSDWVRSDSGRP